MVRTRYKPNPLYKLLSVLLCSALLLNSIALPPVLYAQSTANDQDGKPAVYLPLIQSSPTAALSDKATETATVSAANTPLPTPSGAKPPYPLNHQLDGLFAVAGTPPSNYNFETAGSYVGTPPTNADLSAAVTEVGTLPTNQDFATGNLTGWTTSGTVTIQSDATYSNYARLQSSAVLVSDAFTVDSAALPGFTGADLAIPSADGRELYQFSWEGRHLRTLNALTGATLYTFAYTASGLLDHITDGANNSTLIERAPDGAPTAIVGPYGERTVVGFDSNGYLNLITNPAQEAIHLEYTTLGLLTRMSDPRNSAYASTYLYDSEGRLVRNTNASGGYQTFTRTPTVSGYMVTKQNALGHTTQYAVADLADGRQLRRVIAPNGAFVTTESRLDGTTITTDTRGVVTTLVMGADPRWGMQAPYVRQITSRTPSGQAFFTMTANRTVTLATPTNPLTVQSQVDTVNINGRTTTTSYNGPPRLLITNNPSGEVTTTALDPLGRPVQVNRANFAPVLYVYDSRGRLERVQEGEGANARTTVMAYDALGYLDKVTDALLGETTFTYDAAGRLTAQQLPSLQWLTFDYDDAGNLIKQINAQGVQTDFVYDPHNRLQAQVVDPGGRAVRSEFAYDLADNLTQAVADVGAGRLNLTTHYTYTPFSPGGDYLLQQVIDPEGHATQFTYTPAGDLRTATDALGQTTTYTYTVQGWLTQMRTPQGRVATTLYTNDGQPDWVSDPRGSVTDYGYDAQGRLKTVMAGTVALGAAPALNQTITYTYDVNDRVRIVTDGRNQAHTLSYDAFGRLDWEDDPLGNRITYSYDKLDRLLKQVVGANNPAQAVTTQYSYDAVGRRTTMRLDPDGLNLTTVYSYTQAGSNDTWNLQGIRDPNGNVTKYSYNSLGLRAGTTDALNHTWLFDYDNLGRLTGQTDPLGRAVVYTVDGLGRTTALHQNGRSEQWAFRADGALATYTDFAGRVTSFAYDNDQLLTGIDYPAGMADVSYGYDAAGNITSMSDGLGSTSYGYDVLNRLDTRTRNNRTVDYGYSAANQVTSIDYWGQGTVSYGYDNAGRLDHLTPWGGAATTYSYRSSGLLAGISRPNSVATTYSYDTASRLTGLTHVQGGSNTLNAIVYGLDANGNRVSLTDVDGLTTYVYDALNRLDVATYPAIPGGPPAATIDYSINDVAGARWARTSDGATTYTYDASDRITNSGFVYDDNGNLLNDGVKSYQYDAANRLTKVISGSVSIDYGYDGWGNLILESSNGITTEYVLDERGALPTILGEVRSDGTTRLYAYGPEGFAAQMTVGGAVEYPLLDGLGSVRHLTDGSGTVTLSRSYDAFGNLRHSTGTGATHLGYTGELQDQQTGLVYLRARFYHPVLGRFLQRDSFAGFQQRPQSLNRYSYTENNPVNYTDPSGHYVDTILDVSSIGYDIYRIVQDNILHSCDNLGENIFSLVLDVGGAALPFITGLGVMYRAGKMARFARWWDDFQILHKTGIWGGTIRDIAKALPSDVVMGVRARPMAAGMWELLYKNIGWPVPKPLKDPRSLNAAAELTKRPFVSFEIGLRRMQRLSDGKTFLAHSDIDPQFIIKGGVPILNNQEVLDMIGMINSQIGTTLLQHGDNFSGMWNVIKGASKTDLDRTTVLISNSGYIGRSGDRMGHAAFLGMISDEWRDVFRAFLDQPNFGSKWW